MRKSAKARGVTTVTYLTEEDRKNLRYAENIKRIVIGEPPPHLRRKNAQIGNAPDSMSLGSIGEAAVSPPIMPESQVSGTPEHIHQEGGMYTKPPLSNRRRQLKR